MHLSIRSSRWRVPALAGLILVALLAACGGGNSAPPPEKAGERRLPVAAVEVRARDLSRLLSLSGQVEPRVTVRLAARTSGAVHSVAVEEGAQVAAGQLLAQLDMSEALAELARARAEEHTARLNFQRATDLRERGMVSVAQHESAKVALQVAESEHVLWRTRVEFGRIVSPLDAVVTARHIEPGEAVQAQSTLFELAALDELVVRLGVSELDVVHLRVGQPVPLRLDAFPDLELAGSIRRIAPVGQAANRLITVEVALPGDANARGVRPGFLARMRLAIDSRPSALGVPAHAVGRADGVPFVYVIGDERLSRRAVEIGVTRGEWTEILSGLAAGETVLASNPLEMRDGQRVRIVEVH